MTDDIAQGADQTAQWRDYVAKLIRHVEHEGIVKPAVLRPIKDKMDYEGLDLEGFQEVARELTGYIESHKSNVDLTMVRKQVKRGIEDAMALTGPGSIPRDRARVFLGRLKDATTYEEIQEIQGQFSAERAPLPADGNGGAVALFSDAVADGMTMSEKEHYRTLLFMNLWAAPPARNTEEDFTTPRYTQNIGAYMAYPLDMVGDVDGPLTQEKLDALAARFAKECPDPRNSISRAKREQAAVMLGDGDGRGGLIEKMLSPYVNSVLNRVLEPWDVTDAEAAGLDPMVHAKIKAIVKLFECRRVAQRLMVLFMDYVYDETGSACVRYLVKGEFVKDAKSPVAFVKNLMTDAFMLRGFYNAEDDEGKRVKVFLDPFAAGNAWHGSDFKYQVSGSVFDPRRKEWLIHKSKGDWDNDRKRVGMLNTFGGFDDPGPTKPSFVQATRALFMHASNYNQATYDWLLDWTWVKLNLPYNTMSIPWFYHPQGHTGKSIILQVWGVLFSPYSTVLNPTGLSSKFNPQVEYVFAYFSDMSDMTKSDWGSLSAWVKGNHETTPSLGYSEQKGVNKKDVEVFTSMAMSSNDLAIADLNRRFAPIHGGPPVASTPAIENALQALTMRGFGHDEPFLHHRDGRRDLPPIDEHGNDVVFDEDGILNQAEKWTPNILQENPTVFQEIENGEDKAAFELSIGRLAAGLKFLVDRREPVTAKRLKQLEDGRRDLEAMTGRTHIVDANRKALDWALADLLDIWKEMLADPRFAGGIPMSAPDMLRLVKIFKNHGKTDVDDHFIQMKLNKLDDETKNFTGYPGFPILNIRHRLSYPGGTHAFIGPDGYGHTFLDEFAEKGAVGKAIRFAAFNDGRYEAHRAELERRITARLAAEIANSFPAPTTPPAMMTGLPSAVPVATTGLPSGV